MSYQYGGQQGHGLREFIPHYVVRSDYLPNQVTEGNNAQTQELVIFPLFSSAATKKKGETVECSPKSPLNSTPAGINLLSPTRMSSSTSPSMNSISVGFPTVDPA